jgi:hypothetical protein
MQLPDFSLDRRLIHLKAMMGIPSDVYGAGTGVTVMPGLTKDEQEKLTSGIGIDVTWGDLIILQNGTLVYKGSRVLLYIRDWQSYGTIEDSPRYHLATCRTMVQMHGSGRFERYVVATQEDGRFQVNISNGHAKRPEMKQLAVCQNCLEMLKFEGFRWGLPNRKGFVAGFTPKRFFEKYPKSPHVKVPSMTADQAPPNDYTKDFPEVGRRLKVDRRWKCDECSQILSEPKAQRFLHIHHRDGNRWDNSPKNLSVLCIGCHASQPSHSHMKSLPEYKDYQRAYGRGN